MKLSSLQVEQAQLPQLVFIGEVLQPCDRPLALGEAMLVISCHLPLFHMPQHSFQENLFCDLHWHKGELPCYRDDDPLNP